MLPTIVVSAYNRPQALSRLLTSLQRARYPPGAAVRLHISIDRSDNQEVLQVAERFIWKHGEKCVVNHTDHLGLVRQFFACGNLTGEYGSIILLEDDLVVSPMFYAFASSALEFFERDPLIAGVSLYSLWFNGYTHQPFIPLPDESDIFFLQVPYTQGQAFTRSQWAAFSGWLASGDTRLTPADPIHEMFLHFDPEDWFPIRTKYLISTGRYYVFPRESLATGFGDAGTHFTTASSFFQVPLQRFKDAFRLKPLQDSLAVYDSFFEILPDRLNRLTPAFREFRYDVDLYGEKSLHNLPGDYVLTSKRCKSPVKSFGKQTWPLEANILDEVPGAEIFFCRKADLRLGWLDRIARQKSNQDYFSRRRPFPKKQFLRFALLSLLRKLGFYKN